MVNDNLDSTEFNKKKKKKNISPKCEAEPKEFPDEDNEWGANMVDKKNPQFIKKSLDLKKIPNVIEDKINKKKSFKDSLEEKEFPDE